MSEFKVGDRVRILADSCIKGCEADVVEIEQDRVTISCGVFSGCFNKDGLELVNKDKKPPTLQELVDKETPMKVEEELELFRCPKCNEKLLIYKRSINYCYECGQKLDWSEE